MKICHIAFNVTISHVPKNSDYIVYYVCRLFANFGHNTCLDRFISSSFQRGKRGVCTFLFVNSHLNFF